MTPPADERARVEALGEYQVLDTAPESAFDELVALAAQVCRTPIALVSLVDESRQWFKARVGLNVVETSREIAFCAHTIAGPDDVMVVPDALADTRFADNPLVTSAPHIRSYLGARLVTPSGHAIGTLCVIDRAPRAFTAPETAAVRTLARQIVAQLELRKEVRALMAEREAAASARAELAAGLDRTEALVHAAAMDGRLVFTNPAWRARLGYGEAEIAALNVLDVVAPEEREAWRALLDRVTSGAPAPRVETSLVTRSGDRIEVRGAVHLVEDRAGSSTRAVFWDITPERRAEAALVESEGRFRSLTGAAPIGIYHVDAQGACAYVNPRWCEITGLTEAEASGRGWEAVLHPDDRAKVFAAWVSATKGRAPFVMEARFVTPAGEARWVTSQAARIAHGPGEGGYVGTLEDITARRLLEEERLRVAQLKGEFVATVSHELRTPLTSIRGALGLVSGGAVGALPPEAEALLHIATTNTERLARLVDDLLDVEKLDAGKVTVTRRPLEMVAVVRRAVDESSSLAATRAVVVRTSEGGPAWALADEDRILQVLSNLLSNAIKFSPERGVVDVDVDVSDARVRVSVRDAGPGVPADFVGRLFERFAQADGSDHRLHPGTGLGLCISRALIELLGGTITYAPGAAGGAVFRVELEAAPESAA